MGRYILEEIVFVTDSERENLIRMDYLMRGLEINMAFGKTNETLN